MLDKVRLNLHVLVVFSYVQGWNQASILYPDKTQEYINLQITIRILKKPLNILIDRKLITSMIKLSVSLFLSLIVGTEANDSLPTKNFPFGIVP